jgi:hypothetical protein
MTVSARILSLGQRLLLRLCERRTVAGVLVGVDADNDAESALAFERLDAAVSLIVRHDPRRGERLCRLVHAVLVTGLERYRLGSWWQSLRIVALRRSFVLGPDEGPERIAAALVHESTHAWLEHLGFAYLRDRRARLEAICCRSEIAFARKLPDPKDLVERASVNLARSSDYWTDEAFTDRSLQALLDQGVPQWIVQWLRRRSERSRLTTTCS